MTLEQELDAAERKAFQSLARYKFQMFGYWAAIWVHLNRIEGKKRPNPFKELVAQARMPRHLQPLPKADLIALLTKGNT